MPPGSPSGGETSEGGELERYTPYGVAESSTVFQFGWDGDGNLHLSYDSGEPISDWADNEQLDYGNGRGVTTDLTDPGPSLLLVAVG